MNISKPIIVSIILAVLTPSVLFAGGTPEDSGQAIHVDADGIAAKGADVVAYFSLQPSDNSVAGSEEHAFTWRGATFLFATEENRELFAREPERFAPAFGGYCAWAMARDRLATIDPDMWAVFDGRLYLNYNRRTQNDWLKERDENIRKAETIWPERAAELSSSE